MKITYYGHACFLIETAGNRILIDPFIASNPLAAHIDIQKLRCDFVFLTHAHFDHIADVESIMQHNPHAVIVGIWEIHDHYAKKGFTTHPMNKGGWWKFGFGRVKMVNAVHSSSFPDGSYGGEAAGFVFDTPDAVVYVAGDTALTYDMQLIPMTCPELSVAILPIGGNFTMDYKDAIIASDFLRCNRIIGCHFDTFPYVKVNHEAVQSAFLEKGKDLVLPVIGGTIEI